MLNARLPQFLGAPVVGQLEADGRLVLLEIAGSDFDEETLALVGNLENFRPCKTVDAQSVVQTRSNW